MARTKSKKSKADEAVEALVNRVISAIENDPGSWTKPWVDGLAGGIPINVSSKDRYRGTNVFVLALAGFGSPVWGTYKQWADLGAQVKKGSTSTVGVFWKILKKEEKGADGSSEEVKIPFLRHFNLFNLEQVDVPADSLAAKRVKELVGTEERTVDRIDHAQEFFAAVGADVRELEGNSSAYFSPTSDFISIPGINQFKDAESYYATLGHEHIHWTGHKDRLDRIVSTTFGSEDYAGEELIAELGSALLCAHLGLSAEPRPDHAQYLASWLKVLKETPKVLLKSATKASAALEFLIEAAAAEEVAAAA